MLSMSGWASCAHCRKVRGSRCRSGGEGGSRRRMCSWTVYSSAWPYPESSEPVTPAADEGFRPAGAALPVPFCGSCGVGRHASNYAPLSGPTRGLDGACRGSCWQADEGHLALPPAALVVPVLAVVRGQPGPSFAAPGRGGFGLFGDCHDDCDRDGAGDLLEGVGLLSDGADVVGRGPAEGGDDHVALAAPGGFFRPGSDGPGTDPSPPHVRPSRPYGRV